MNEHGWSVPDEASSEEELREVLTALVRMLKPDLVVETGTFRGYATRALALGCFRNGKGRVVSCDTDSRHQLEAIGRVAGLGVELRIARGADLPELREADFVFCDSDYACREEEIALAKPGAVVVVHDTRISYDSRIPPHEGLVRRLGGITFDSHRGWGLLRKR